MPFNRHSKFLKQTSTSSRLSFFIADFVQVLGAGQLSDLAVQVSEILLSTCMIFYELLRTKEEKSGSKK